MKSDPKNTEFSREAFLKAEEGSFKSRPPAPKHNIVAQVEGVVELNGKQYLEGVRKSEDVWNGTKVLMSVDDEVHKMKRGDFKRLMSPSYEHQVKPGGVMYFRSCEKTGTHKVDNQEYLIYNAAYYDVLQHKSMKENAKFMSEIDQHQPGDGITVSLQGKGYTSFWTAKQSDGSYKPSGKSVLYRIEDAEKQTISSLDELKEFIKGSLENYNPSSMKGAEVRRLRLLLPGDENASDAALDTQFELTSFYDEHAFEVKGKPVGGYAVSDEVLDKMFDRALSKSGDNILKMAVGAFESDMSLDFEVLPGKAFYWGRESLLGVGIFDQDGQYAPASEEGGKKPVLLRNNLYRKPVKTEKEDGSTEVIYKAGVAPQVLSVKIKATEDGGHQVFCLASQKNAAKGLVYEFGNLDTPNFVSPVTKARQAAKQEAESKSQPKAKPQSNQSTQQSSNQTKPKPKPAEKEPATTAAEQNHIQGDAEEPNFDEIENDLDSLFEDEAMFGNGMGR